MASIGQPSNPISILNSYHAGCAYRLVEESGPPHNKQFVYCVHILGFDYKGSGPSKKKAKSAAASVALKKLYSINLGLNGGELATPTIEPENPKPSE